MHRGLSLFVFFFKQKTAYEMRISDWSSDVCSSDLSMSAANLRFQVDSRLATLLSQEYRSTERALKELVDNAWDADADQVSIQLPKPLSGEQIGRASCRERVCQYV